MTLPTNQLPMVSNFSEEEKKREESLTPYALITVCDWNLLGDMRRNSVNERACKESINK